MRGRRARRIGVGVRRTSLTCTPESRVWQDYQDDDDDFFDTYDSRRDDRDLSNRNRV